MTNHENLIKYLKTQFRIVELILPKVSRKPSGKSIHQLRLATRRARVALWILENSSSAVRFKELSHDLRKLGKTLGQIREVEVSIQDANHYDLELFDLKTRRTYAQKEIQNLVSEKKRNDLAKKFADAENAIGNIGPASFSLMRDKLIVKIHRQLKLCARGEIKPHKLRIVLKRTRYALEAIGKSVAKIKSLQDVLGDAHDLVTLQMYVGKNRKIKHEQHALNVQATRLIKPTLHFVVAQLEGV
ncbi:MAG: hypothetical protein B7Y39_04425 [Bdellovibrio sp. 28-41-41]|nr:MAG: hypothetical protein B7Y39_04425 [Bdellovibrio sp. 28-41-41]